MISISIISCKDNEEEKLKDQLSESKAQVVQSAKTLAELKTTVEFLKATLEQTKKDAYAAVSNLSTNAVNTINAGNTPSTATLTLPTQPGNNVTIAQNPAILAPIITSSTSTPPPSGVLTPVPLPPLAPTPPTPPPPPPGKSLKTSTPSLTSAPAKGSRPLPKTPNGPRALPPIPTIVSTGSVNNPTSPKQIINSLQAGPGDLFEQIKKGTKLKKVEDTSKSVKANEDDCDKLPDLRKTLCEALKNMRGDIEGSDEEEDDDDWDDIKLMINSNNNQYYGVGEDSKTKKGDTKELINSKIVKANNVNDNMQKQINLTKEKINDLSEIGESTVKQLIVYFENLNAYNSKIFTPLLNNANFKKNYDKHTQGKSYRNPKDTYISSVTPSKDIEVSAKNKLELIPNKGTILPLNITMGAAGKAINALQESCDEINNEIPEDLSNVANLIKHFENIAELKNNSISASVNQSYKKIKTNYKVDLAAAKTDWSKEFSNAKFVDPNLVPEKEESDKSNNDPVLTEELYKKIKEVQTNEAILRAQGIQVPGDDNPFITKIMNGEIRYRSAKSFDNKIDVIYYMYNTKTNEQYYLKNDNMVKVGPNAQTIDSTSIYFTKEIWDTFTDSQKANIQTNADSGKNNVKQNSINIAEYVKNNKDKGDTFEVIGNINIKQNDEMGPYVLISEVGPMGLFINSTSNSNEQNEEENNANPDNEAEGNSANNDDDDFNSPASEGTKLTELAFNDVISNLKNMTLLKKQSCPLVADSNKATDFDNYTYLSAKINKEDKETIYYLYNNVSKKEYYLDNDSLVPQDLHQGFTNLDDQTIFFSEETWNTFSEDKKEFIQNKLNENKNLLSKKFSLDEYIKKTRIRSNSYSINNNIIYLSDPDVSGVIDLKLFTK